MFNSRNLGLTLAAMAVLGIAGCSNTANKETENTPPAPAAAKKPATPKPTATKPVQAAKAAPAAKLAPSTKAVPAKPEAKPTAMLTVPKGTVLSAKLGKTLASDKNKAGDTFTATLAAPVTLDGKTVIAKGTQVNGKIVAVKKHELKLTLASVVIHGKSYPLETNSTAGPKSQPAQKNAKASDEPEVNKDITVIAAKTQMTFKLAKPLAIPGKPAKPAKSTNATKATKATKAKPAKATVTQDEG